MLDVEREAKANERYDRPSECVLHECIADDAWYPIWNSDCSSRASLRYCLKYGVDLGGERLHGRIGLSLNASEFCIQCRMGYS